ncbi:hypothetical protein JCM5353_007249 [Sporobolomyces roseus]
MSLPTTTASALEASRLSPALYAVEAFVEQVRNSQNKKPIMPYFCLRGEAAIEVLTGVRMRKGRHSLRDRWIDCYAIEADAPEGRHVEIRAAFEKHVVKSRVLSNGFWSILPERSQASASDLELLFEVGSDEASTPVKLTLHTKYERTLLNNLESEYLDYSRLDHTWSICTFQPEHLKFRVYSPTPILIVLLFRLPQSFASVGEHEYELQLIMLLLEKGYEARLQPDSNKEKLAHFAFGTAWETLDMTGIDYVERADHNARYIFGRINWFAAQMSSLRQTKSLEGSRDVVEIRSSIVALWELFEGYYDILRARPRQDSDYRGGQSPTSSRHNPFTTVWDTAHNSHHRLPSSNFSPQARP